MVQLSCLDHQSASLAQREEAIEAFQVLGQSPGILLATCNRLEYYQGRGEVPYEVARHLFRVTSGIESRLPGEHAIQQQVKEAYLKAAQQFALSSSLHRLFQNALRVGKKVRHQTGIARGAGSHSQLAFEVIRETVANFRSATITLIGINNLNECIIRYLRKSGLETFYVGNRTYDHAVRLARQYGGKAFGFNDLHHILTRTDVLVTATAAPHIILPLDIFPTNRPMCIIDLAFPRDVDPAIGTLPGVQLFQLSQLEERSQRNIAQRQLELESAACMVDHETNLFISQHHQWLWKHCA